MVIVLLVLPQELAKIISADRSNVIIVLSDDESDNNDN